MASFTYKGDSFYLNGEKYTVLSGAMHYFRIPQEYWYDRLLKLKECGLNTIETYACWNLHEKNENEFDFSGNLDVVKFICTAKDLDLNVILRIGPYICAEWDFGGFPAWLLKYKDMVLRANDELYLSKVKRYFDNILPLVKPHLCTNGGNIIMMQIENEYGSYGNDKEYLRNLAKMYYENGIDCLLFTSDGTTKTMLGGGTLKEYLSVVNFDTDPKIELKALTDFKKNQPLMCGEYWCGWFDHWFENHHTKDQEKIISHINDFLDMGASFNLYMFCGGTNFGFLNGANFTDKYEPLTTSYDYLAPLNEAGDMTPLYYEIRKAIKNHGYTVPEMTAKDSEKAAYGTVKLDKYADLFDNLDNISTPIHSPTPKFMEDIGQNYGYILYRTTLLGPREGRIITIERVRDRAQLFLDKEPIGVYYRAIEGENRIPARFGDLEKDEIKTLDILAENMGRVHFGPELYDRKGIFGVRMRGQYHFSWDIYPLPMENELENLKFSPISNDDFSYSTPVFFKGSLNIDGTPSDTFLNLSGLHKGFVKINGKNVGRYFNDAPPQKTLYIPATVLKSGKNEILVFESDKAESPSLNFIDKPIFE